jgi:hypothetical protein
LGGTVTSVFDQAFFEGEFSEKALEFVREQEGLGIAVEIVTLSGEHLDVLEIVATDEGARLVTRGESLVFLPYAQIAHVGVSGLRDHRIASFQLATSVA